MQPYEHEFASIAVLDVGGMHFGFQHPALGIDQHVTFAPGDLLAPVIATDPTHAGHFDGLAVDNASTGLRIASGADADHGASDRMDPFPGAVAPPDPIVMVDGLPQRQVVR